MKKQIKQHQKRERKLQKQRLKELRGRRLGLYIHIPFAGKSVTTVIFTLCRGMGTGWKII